MAPDLEQQSQRTLNREIRRHTDVVGIFPDRGSIIRLVAPWEPDSTTSGPKDAATLASDILARNRLTKINNDTSEGEAMTPAALTA